MPIIITLNPISTCPSRLHLYQKQKIAPEKQLSSLPLDGPGSIQVRQFRANLPPPQFSTPLLPPTVHLLRRLDGVDISYK